MFLISFWQVLVFLIAFFIIKTSQEWGRILCSPWQSKLKLKHMKNPSFGALCNLWQANQVCKEENKRRNLTSSNFAWLCEIFAKHVKCPKGDKLQDKEQYFRKWISQALRNQSWGKWISLAPILLDFYLEIFCVITYFLLVIS